ncbi:Holliday junction DNA helicase RuvB C-terminal domain-containing protein [Limnoglobus roseus]|uniref:Holliday junction DNA helicase RuvB n=1 Tax=Limnoglobus roseus TaxID=2598579 RepID=A0A5C1AI61_9BACT|nr:Holliday junction DNA helicase RuvB C-terminal domain-containing protein [Limnoglobus roseus]QEL17857.1 Holliday junction DNA helicase RuvB [Limnoglobus roseus]
MSNSVSARPSVNSLVAPTLDHVIGQKQAVGVLRTALDAHFHDRSKATDELAFPHLLLTGPGGTGKTLLSELVGRAVAGNFHSELAQNLKSPEHVRGLLMMLEPGDVVYCDEIHELPTASAIALYRSLEEGLLFLGKKHVVQLPPFCLIGATTHEHLLAPSLRQRFRILLRLSHYSDEEMFELLRQRAKRLGWEVEDDAVRRLATKSRGVARLGVRLLESSRRTASAQATDAITVGHVERMCEVEGIDPLGFDAIERRYLEVLRDGDGPVRLNLIQAALGLPRQTVEMFEEDFLRLGLISKSDKGRMLTAKGYEHVAGTAP